MRDPGLIIVLAGDQFFGSGLENHDTYKAGKTTKVKNVAVIKPPMITMANGRWVSDPISWLKAIGNRPRAANKAVMSTVLNRCKDPSFTASLTFKPAARNC